MPVFPSAVFLAAVPAFPSRLRAFRTQSVMRERGLSSIRLWNQMTGSTSTMPTREMKSVKRPIATPAAFEKVSGGDKAKAADTLKVNLSTLYRKLSDEPEKR